MDSGFSEGTCGFIPGSLIPEKWWSEEEWQKAHGRPTLWKHNIPGGCSWRRASPWKTSCNRSSLPLLYWLDFPRWLFLRSHWPRMAGMSILNQSLSKGLRQLGQAQTNHDWLSVVCGGGSPFLNTGPSRGWRLNQTEALSVTKKEVCVCVCVYVCVCVCVCVCM